jgi:hypothetical protein
VRLKGGGLSLAEIIGLTKYCQELNVVYAMAGGFHGLIDKFAVQFFWLSWELMVYLLIRPLVLVRVGS